VAVDVLHRLVVVVVVTSVPAWEVSVAACARAALNARVFAASVRVSATGVVTASPVCVGRTFIGSPVSSANVRFA
jgi:hypothetical protein